MKRAEYPNQKNLRKQYDEFLIAREKAANELAFRIKHVVRVLSSPPTVKARVKSFGSYYKKYIRFLKNRGNSGSVQIFDIIGIRVVCPFLDDLADVKKLIKENYEIIDEEHKGGNWRFKEFGYESIHLSIKIPSDVMEVVPPINCKTAEIQIRTILQDAWAEVEHELVYKAEFNPFGNPMKRKLHAVSASLTLADIIFQEIRAYQRRFNGEIEKRRGTFFKKVDSSTDALLFTDEETLPPVDDAPLTQIPSLDMESVEPYELVQSAGFTESTGPIGIDELLLSALTAHNQNRFSDAIACYTRILEDFDVDDSIKSVIYKHRGLAFFSRSRYEDAIGDFSRALELDPSSYKASYDKGIACSVLRQYQEAVEAFNQALKINPYQPYCLYRRGQAYFHLEDYPQALADCEAALALEPFEGARKFRQLILNKIKM